MNFNELRKHIEKYNGEPKQVIEEKNSQLLLAEFNAPYDDMFTYITSGLYKHKLKQVHGSQIRAELQITIHNDFKNAISFSDVLLSVAIDVLESHNALSNGQLIETGKEFFNNYENLFGLVVCQPAFFPREYGYFKLNDNELPVIFMDLIPITEKECVDIKKNGWELFFDRINNEDIQILDLRR